MMELIKFEHEGLKCFYNNNISWILFLTLRLFERCTQICYSFVEIFDVVCQFSWSSVFVYFTNFVIFQQVFEQMFPSFFLRQRATDGKIRSEIETRCLVGNSQSVSRSCPRRAGLNENKIKLCQVLKLRTYRRNNPIPSARRES